MPILMFVSAGIGFALVLIVVLMLFMRISIRAQLSALRTRLDDIYNAQSHASECLERELRSDVTETARMTRVELSTGLAQFQQSLSAQLTSIATLQNNQIDSFGQQLAKLTEGNTTQLEAMRQSVQQQAQQAREEQGIALKRFSDTLNQQLSQLSEENSRRITEMRATLEQKLKDIETNNALKLDEMRHVVDEKLHATLEQRLGESFKLVGEQLEQVYRGLGEMQTLATGVGDLKKVLTNVKTRGTWGEVQLGALLEQVLTPDQYAKNVVTVPGSSEHVEFALRLPGRYDNAVDASGLTTPVWLPIDAKFPRADYERLIDAQELADPVALEEASRALDVCVRQAARTIAQKYLAPPHTTDFGILFLPTEGLYAEVLRRPGLSDALQRDYRITVAGPTTLTALLNSLQMGFRTLAIEKRSSEVWRVLGAVKTEFMKFGEVLAKTKSQLETVTRSIEAAETRTRVMHKQLRTVEALPSESAAQLLMDTE